MDNVSEPDGGWKRHNGICFARPWRHGRIRVAFNSFLLGGRITAPETRLIWEAAALPPPAVGATRGEVEMQRLVSVESLHVMVATCLPMCHFFFTFS